jgi:GDP-L-fucose synthase
MPILDYFILNDPLHSEYNITPNASIELLEAARIVQRISGNQIDIQVGQPDLGIEYSGDNSRLKNEFKELTFTPIEESIEKLYNWYSSNLSTIRKEVLLTDK